MQYIPCTGVVAGLRLLLVHAGPCVLAAAHIDGVARRNGDHLRPLEEAAALLIGGDLLVQEDLRQIVLVGGGGRQLQVGALAVDGQRVLVGVTGLAGGEPGQQLAAPDVQRRKGGVGVVPCTAQIGAQALAGIHDADHVAVAQRAVLHGELREAEVGEPVVQRAHPAGVVAAVHLGQSLDRGDIAILRAGLGEAILLQRRHDAVHHGAVGVQVDPLIHQLAVPVFLTVRPQIAGKGGVLHDDLHLAVVGSLTHGHHGGLIRLVHLGGGSGGLNGLHARVIGGLYAVAGQTVLHGVQTGDGGVLGSLRVAADRGPGDGDGHIVKARGELQERVGDLLIAHSAVPALVLAGIVKRSLFAGIAGVHSVDRNALDHILRAVDRIGHVAQYLGGVAAVGIRHIHGSGRVGNAPASAGNDAGAVLFARADGCIAAQEVRGVVGIHAGVDILRQRGGLGDLGISRAVVGASAGTESEQLGLHIIADAGAGRVVVPIVRAGTVLQIGDHAVQRRLIGCGNLAVILLKRQLILLRGSQTVRLRLDDGVVLLLLTARQLAPLIGRHSLVAGLQIIDLRLGGGIQLGHIVGQVAQIGAEVVQIAGVEAVRVRLQLLDGLDGCQLCVAGGAGSLRRVDGRHGGVVGVLHLLPVGGGEHALGVLLIVVHGVQLRAELPLHGVHVAGGGDVHQYGGPRDIAALIVQTERIQQHIALVIQGQGGLAALVRHGVGIHAHIAGGSGLGALRRGAAVDLRARHRRGTGSGVEGHRRFRRHTDGERLARLHLHGSGNGAVAEPVNDILHHRVVGGAVLTGVGDLLGIDVHHGQLVAVVQLHRLENIAPDAVLGHAKPVIQQLAVQEIQRVIAARKRGLAGQGGGSAGVGVQCQGGGIGVRVAVGRRELPIYIGGVQLGHLHGDLLLGHGFQSVGCLSQIQ